MHKHKWIFLKKFYAQPSENCTLSLKGESTYAISSTVEKVHLGVTTWVWKCDICGKLKEHEFLGKEDECLVFIEVKLRNTFAFGFPEQAVDRKKQEHMINSAIWFIQENYPLDSEWRIDVVAINILNNDPSPNIKWFKNAIIS